MPTTINTLDGVAIKGNIKQRHEAFMKGTINGDRMTLVFSSVNRVQVSPRRWKHERVMRFMQCERVFSPSHADFWWRPVKGSSQTMTTDCSFSS